MIIISVNSLYNSSKKMGGQQIADIVIISLTIRHGLDIEFRYKGELIFILHRKRSAFTSNMVDRTIKYRGECNNWRDIIDMQTPQIVGDINECLRNSIIETFCSASLKKDLLQDKFENIRNIKENFNIHNILIQKKAIPI